MEFRPPDRSGFGVSRRVPPGLTLAVVPPTAGCSGASGSNDPPETTAEPTRTDAAGQTTGDSRSHAHAGGNTSEDVTAAGTATGAPTETNAGGTNATGQTTVVVDTG